MRPLLFRHDGDQQGLGWGEKERTGSAWDKSGRTGQQGILRKEAPLISPNSKLLGALARNPEGCVSIDAVAIGDSRLLPWLAPCADSQASVGLCSCSAAIFLSSPRQRCRMAWAHVRLFQRLMPYLEVRSLLAGVGNQSWEGGWERRWRKMFISIKVPLSQTELVGFISSRKLDEVGHEDSISAPGEDHTLLPPAET
eukprot:767594-Hanusia_phi.AAC.18